MLKDVIMSIIWCDDGQLRGEETDKVAVEHNIAK